VMRAVAPLLILGLISCAAHSLPIIQPADFGINYLYFTSLSFNSQPANKKINVYGTELLLNRTWQLNEYLLLGGSLGMGGSTLSSDQLNYDPPFSRRGGMAALGGGLKYQLSPDRFLDAQLLFIPMNPGLEYEYIVPHAKYGLYSYSWLEFQLSAGMNRDPFYFGLRYSYLNLLAPSVTKQADAGFESLIAALPESFDPLSSFGIFIGAKLQLSPKTHLLAEISLLDKISANLGMGVEF